MLLNVVEYRVVELRYKTFIACNALYTGSNFLLDDWFESDDRNFGYAATTSRSFQSYYLTVGQPIMDGLIVNGATEHFFDESRAFDNDAINVGPCPPGQVCPRFCTHCILPTAVPECSGTAEPGQDGNVLSAAFERLDASTGRVTLDLGIANK